MMHADSHKPAGGQRQPAHRHARHHPAAAGWWRRRVVLPSIFEEKIIHEQELLEALVTNGIGSFGEALSYFKPGELRLRQRTPPCADRTCGCGRRYSGDRQPQRVTGEGWIEHAGAVEHAGAQAIELNIYFIPSDLSLSSHDVEQRYLDVLAGVKSSVNIPVAVKIGPYVSAPGHMAMRLDAAGADGLGLFNRFYEPDIDLKRLELSPSLELSEPYEMRLPLLWIGILAGRARASLAATSGVDSGDDVVKYILAGADVVMTTSALLRHGGAHRQVLSDQLSQWLEARGLDSPNAIRRKITIAPSPTLRPSSAPTMSRSCRAIPSCWARGPRLAGRSANNRRLHCASPPR
jgi:dihydroorotate dehydrogenase (fumarate)